MENIFKIGIATSGATLSYLFGEWSALLGILVAFVTIDYLTGVLAGYYTKDLSSKIGFRGIVKKVMIFTLVMVGNLIDMGLGDSSFIRDAVIFFFLANELLSILENASKTDINIPPILQKAVEALKSRSDK